MYFLSGGLFKRVERGTGQEVHFFFLQKTQKAEDIYADRAL